jgi:hypothetical protein
LDTIPVGGRHLLAETLVGTGTEDYIGTAWGQSAYINRYQGAPVATWGDEGRWTFYRFHVPDPVLFRRGIEVSLQQMAGARKNIVLGLQRKGAPMIPVTIDPGSRNDFQKLLETGKRLDDPSLPNGHINYTAATMWRRSPISTSIGQAACSRRSRARRSACRR